MAERTFEEILEMYEDLYEDLECLVRSMEANREPGDPRVWIVARTDPRTEEMWLEHLTEVRPG